jgi:2-hydroxy fatty acid dioxygenase
MRRIDALLADYGSYHRTWGNLACHAVGITLILFGVVSMLQRIPVAGACTASEVLIAAGFLFYLTLDWALALAVLGAAGLLDLAARAIGDWRVGVTAFLVGWIFQSIGHAVFEKNSPAFLKNIIHLMVGPAYLLNEALRLRRAGPESG